MIQNKIRSAFFIFALSLFIRFSLFKLPHKLMYEETIFFEHVDAFLKDSFYFSDKPPLIKVGFACLLKLLKIDSIDIENKDLILKNTHRVLLISRFLSAILLAMTHALTYKLLQLFCDQNKALMITMFFVLENSMYLTVGFLLEESCKMFCNLCVFYFFIKYRKNCCYSYLYCCSLMLSILLASDHDKILIYVLLLTLCLYDLLQISVDKARPLLYGKNSVAMSTIHVAISFILVPLMVYVCTFYTYFMFQNKYTNAASIFSLHFQGQLENNYLEESDRYLVDRSLVTLTNTENKVYIKSEAKNYKKGSEQQIVYAESYKDEKAIWKIIKIHVDPDDVPMTDEKRNFFVRNGDYIKLVHVLTDRYLHSHNIESENSCNKKLKEVSCYGGFREVVTDDNDYWIVQSDTEYVMTRISNFKLLHVKTGTFLGVKTAISINSDERHEVYTSVEGAKQFRNFIFEDNRIDEHHRTTNKDDRIQHKIKNYGKLPFLKKFIEYHSKMLVEKTDHNDEANRITFKPISIPFINNYKINEMKKNKNQYNDYTAINDLNWNISVLVFLLPIVIILNKALFIRFAKGFYVPSAVILLLTVYFINYLKNCFCDDQILISEYIFTNSLALLPSVYLISMFRLRILLIFLSITASSFIISINQVNNQIS
ncbi:Protein O-mannosyltransferase 2 [Conglomerata obtusa]